MKNNIWIKFTSGRFLLTMAGALVFVWKALNETLPPTAVAAILASVFTHYFTKEQNSNILPNSQSKQNEHKS